MIGNSEVLTVDSAAARSIRSKAQDAVGHVLVARFRFPIEDGRPLLSQRSSVNNLLVEGVMKAERADRHTFVRLECVDSQVNLRPPRLEALSLTAGGLEITNAQCSEQREPRNLTSICFCYDDFKARLFPFAVDAEGATHLLQSDEVMRQFALMTLMVASNRLD